MGEMVEVAWFCFDCGIVEDGLRVDAAMVWLNADLAIGSVRR
jgi:hypothetical protein